MSTIPTFYSHRTGEVPVLNDGVDRIIPILSSAEQREFMNKLEAFRVEIEARGEDREFLKGLGAVPPADFDTRLAKAVVLDTCNWKIAQGLRYSTPTRIAEAVPYLERVIAHFTAQNDPGVVDAVPEMYLAVALHKQPGQEDAALAHFRKVFEYSPAIEMQFHTQLWSRACYSRFLRRLGKIADAEKEEDMIRDWLQWHPYGMPPDEFRELVSDPEHEGKDYILDHPMVQNAFKNMVQVGPGMVVHFG